MDKQQRIAESLKEIAANYGPSIFHDAEILDINSTTYTTDLKLDNGTTVFDCRLRAAISSNNSIDVLPVVGSSVVVCKIDDDDYLVIACDELTEYRVTVGGTVHKITSQGHEIKKGSETLQKILADFIDIVLTMGSYKDVPGLKSLKVRANSLLK